MTSGENYSLLESLKDSIRESTDRDFIQKTFLDDWGLVISYYGPDAEELVAELIRSPAMDIKKVASRTAGGVFRSVFSPDVIASIEIFLREINEVLENQPEGLIDFFTDPAAKERLRNLNEDEYGRIIGMLRDFFLSLKNAPHRVEFDSIMIRLKYPITPAVLEFKMFTSSLSKPTEGLSRYLSPALLQKYLDDPQSMYCLIALSFIHKPPESLTDAPHPTDLPQYIPISAKKYGLPSAWALHLIIMDSHALDYIKNVSYLRDSIFNTINSHLSGIKASYFPGSDLNLRITYNYVKVVEMSSIIYDLMDELNQTKNELEKIKRLLAEKEPIVEEKERIAQEKEKEIRHLKELLKKIKTQEQ